MVARGQADAYIRMPTRKGYIERIWDHAAGSLVATETGCVVTDIAGRPLDFRARAVTHPCGVVASQGQLHDEILRRMAPLVNRWL